MLRSSTAAQRHLPVREENQCENSYRSSHSPRSTGSMLETKHQSRIEVPKKSYQVHRIDSNQNRKRLRSRTMHSIIHMFILLDSSMSEASSPPLKSEYSILTQLFANQRHQRITPSSSLNAIQSDLSNIEQNDSHSLVNRSMPQSILVSSFLAQENSKFHSSKERSS